MKLQDMNIENYDIATNTVNGNLNLKYDDVTELPYILKVKGYLDLSHTKITKLPTILEVADDLDLNYTKIEELSPNLVVGGGMYLYNTKISKLQRGLKVGKKLDLRHTKITEIPSDLEVGDVMYLDETKITNYPVVYNCGCFSRAIYLDLKDKSLICIGCFKGTKEEAIKAVNDEYINTKVKKAYIAKIELCFSMWEIIKHK